MGSRTSVLTAPLAVAARLNFRESLPLHAMQQGFVADTFQANVDSDALPFDAFGE